MALAYHGQRPETVIGAHTRYHTPSLMSMVYKQGISVYTRARVHIKNQGGRQMGMVLIHNPQKNTPQTIYFLLQEYRMNTSALTTEHRTGYNHSLEKYHGQVH